MIKIYDFSYGFLFEFRLVLNENTEENFCLFLHFFVISNFKNKMIVNLCLDDKFQGFL